MPDPNLVLFGQRGSNHPPTLSRPAGVDQRSAIPHLVKSTPGGIDTLFTTLVMLNFSG